MQERVKLRNVDRERLKVFFILASVTLYETQRDLDLQYAEIKCEEQRF